MTRHSSACDCATCLRHFRQRNLWLGSIYAALYIIAAVQVSRWLHQLLSR